MSFRTKWYRNRAPPNNYTFPLVQFYKLVEYQKNAIFQSDWQVDGGKNPTGQLICNIINSFECFTTLKITIKLKDIDN